MTYGNAHLRGWLRLCVLFVSLLSAVGLRAQYPQTVVTVDISGVNPTNASYFFSRHIEGIIKSATKVGTGMQLVVTGKQVIEKNSGWVGGQVEFFVRVGNTPWTEFNSALSGSERMFNVTSGQTLIIWIRYMENDGQPFKDRYSDPWEPPAQMKLLQWTLTNTTSDYLVAGAFLEDDPDWCWTGLPPLYAVRRVPPGESQVVKFYLSEKDPARVTAGFVDKIATLAYFKDLYIITSTTWPDGTPTSVRMAKRLESFPAVWKTQADGDVVLTVDVVQSVSEPTKLQPGTSAPIAGDAVKVPDGGTGGATGKELTDSANAIIGQAHEDAKKLQGSLEGVKTAVQQQTAAQIASSLLNSGNSGGGTTTVADDSAQAKSAADAAQGTKNSMGNGTSDQDRAKSDATNTANTGRENANQVIQQFGTVPTISQPSTEAPRESITLTIN